MGALKFDGSRLKEGSRTVANVRGEKICKSSGSATIFNIRGDKICEGSGSKTLFNVRGDKICEGSGSKKIATMKDVDKAISGPGKLIKAALWLCFVR
ncbi:MAG: hypothetical protein ACJAT2_003642 [Bacteriovoracaceae bacterium]|jgi:hypothetical protein